MSPKVAPVSSPAVIDGSSTRSESISSARPEDPIDFGLVRTCTRGEPCFLVWQLQWSFGQRRLSRAATPGGLRACRPVEHGRAWRAAHACLPEQPPLLIWRTNGWQIAADPVQLPANARDPSPGTGPGMAVGPHVVKWEPGLT